MFFFLHAGDGFLEEGDVAVDVGGFRLRGLRGRRRASDARTMQASSSRTGLPLSKALHDAVDIAGGFEPFDISDLLAGRDRVSFLHRKFGLDEFAEHAGGEFGEADAPQPARPTGAIQ